MTTFSSVAESFKDSTVFLTGATGFLGKGVLEKILRCMEVKKVYILVRNRKEDTAQKRLDEIINSHAFTPLREKNPDFIKKLVLIPGDLLQPRLGISDEDHEILLKETNFVFHNAATTRFDTYLPQALKINFLSTRDLMIMAKSMPLLKGFVHVSTAYANCNRSYIGEEIYESTFKPDEMLGIMKVLNEDFLTEITKSVLGEWPNTYTFTKCLAENVVNELAGNLPVAIVRPSIVIGAEKEPILGYLDGWAGINMINVATGTGILRVLEADSNVKFDLVPLDYVVNSIIAACWKLTLKKERDQIPVYNAVSGPENPILLGEYNRICSDLVRQYVSVRCVVYPVCYPIFVMNSYLFASLKFYLHTIPAVILDALADIQGIKTLKLRMIYAKMDKASAVLRLFMTHSWDFASNNTISLYQSLSETDKDIFYFDMKKIDWKNLMKCMVIGTRRYIAKETDDSIPKAISRLPMLRIVHHTYITVTVLLALAFLWFLYKTVFI